jgi:hypothetical protein
MTKPTYSTPDRPKGERVQIQFTTSHPILNAHLPSDELAGAVYSAVRDAAIDLSDLTDPEQVYQAVRERIDQGRYLIHE